VVICQTFVPDRPANNSGFRYSPDDLNLDNSRQELEAITATKII